MIKFPAVWVQIKSWRGRKFTAKGYGSVWLMWTNGAPDPTENWRAQVNGIGIVKEGFASAKAAQQFVETTIRRTK